MNKSSSGSSSSRTRYKDQIHVKGRFGTRTVRRDDEPDFGDGSVEAVVSFDGAVGFRNESVIGCVSLDEWALEQFIDHIDGRVDEYEVHTFEVTE